MRKRRFCTLRLLNFLWFNTPQLAAEHWGCGGFVPPHTQRFQGEIFNTPEQGLNLTHKVEHIPIVEEGVEFL
jgi:hypothetical protein